MKLITKQELDKLTTQVKDVLLEKKLSLEKIFEENNKDLELIEKIKTVLYFSPIYYPKNVIVSKVLSKDKFFCRIKMERYWEEDYFLRRQIFQDIFKIKPIITEFSEKFPRKNGIKHLFFLTDYISFYFHSDEIPSGMDAQEYANSIATSNILKRLFPQIFDLE
jgi:hypothetical protein